MDEPTNPKSKRALDSRKVFDVAKPGKSVPSQNSRPTILTHSALPYDPMVSKDDNNSMGDTITVEVEGILDETDEIKERPSKTLIEPVESEASIDAIENSDSDKPMTVPENDPPVEVKEAIEPSKAVKHTGLVVEPISEKTDEATKTAQETEDDLDEINEYAGQAAAKKAKKTEDEEELKRTQAALELIESKKYFVPISKRRGRHVIVWFMVILLLAAAASAAGYWYLTQ